MLYTSTKLTLPTLLHRISETPHKQDRRPQHKRYASYPLRNLACLVSLTLSACATQPFPTTLPVSHVQTVKQPQPSTQQPEQSVTAHVAEQVVVTAPAAFTRGQEALQAGQYEKAIALFDQAIQHDTTNALYYLWLGRAYGHQAEQTKAGEQFFLARQVRKNLEKAVTLNPDLIEARLDLLTYYLQAPGLLGGGIEKAQAQAEEITKRDPHKGALAKQQCQRAAEEGSSLLSVSR